MARDTPERSPAELVRLDPLPGPSPSRPPAGRRRTTLRHLAGAAVLAALVAGAVPALLSGAPAARRAVVHKRPEPPPTQARIPFGDPNDPGVDAIAAAFKGPLRCLSLTFAPADPSYARSSVGAGGVCGPYRGYQGAVFRLLGSEWHLVLAGGPHQCPAPGVPANVQAQLGICLRRG